MESQPSLSEEKAEVELFCYDLSKTGHMDAT